MVDAFRHADGPAPRRLGPFMRWCLSGAFPAIFVALALSVIVGLMELAAAWFVGWAIDSAQATGPDFLSTQVAALIAIGVFLAFLRPAVMALNAAMTSLALGPNLYPLILTRLNRHTIGQAMKFFDDDFAGRIAQKSQQTARALTDVVVETCNIFGFAIASTTGAMVLMGSVNVELAVVLIVWLALYILLIRWYLPRIRVRSRARASARAMVTGQIVDTVTNIATVKLFSHGDHEDRAAIDALGKFRGASLGFGRLVVGFRLTLFTLAGLLPVVLIGLTLHYWSVGTATAGDIAMAGLISMRLAQMSGWVSFTALGIFANIGEIEDGMRTLSPPHAIQDKPGAVWPAPQDAGIRFEGINFGYGREGSAALADFNLSIRPGEKVALVGQSGAGKTTVVSLLLRLYEIEEGRILLGDNDIRDIAQDGLRKQISVVRQETAMFNRSARENIRYGRIEATDAEVVEAARRASADDFIHELRDLHKREGYDAHLGERGVKLSGGQRQRIALARAILKDAPVLVLDEATSALDSEVEAEIQTALHEVMEGKTVVAIAHRLSTIAEMDRIVVMDQGRIVEEGTHEDLLSRGGLYARFWRRQSGGFLDLKAAE
ncbi:ABC transporter ATP-binding protein [Algicella marina]|uniref:ATP-binding cassette domain-containing protein n=1 Tax=Algicella marina TaxID=2683284 RepID=A0A6P1TA30_9RHOB|nr:ABC transporter ATP-binding protein [Algicella marina]QHQ37492.1 ATP-binding cassette domain-containing protein [Algicella marina]